ncbi:MAG: aspartate kinase [Firmicutes bacterium]|nr:aspartate kinase [Bacillota bacterium]
MVVVKKFGGSSLASAEHFLHVAKKVQQAVQAGEHVVVVVSAMGDHTDELVAVSRALSENPSPREMDVLLSTGEMASSALMAMALEQLGLPARSFSGGQAGIHTDSAFSRAHILFADVERVQAALQNGIIPVVAGFQGVTEHGEITTLGRGGSDLTAIVLANALHADRCEIYSDVAGIYTTDPRIVPTAVPLGSLSYEEMLELASQGAQVLQSQAVEYARGQHVEIYARSTFSEAVGTVIAEVPPINQRAVTAVALNRHIAKVVLLGIPDAPGVAALLFDRLASQGINIELVIQSMGHDYLNDIAFTIDADDVQRARGIVERCVQDLHGQSYVVDTQVAKVSAVGSGMLGRPGVAATFFQAMAAAGINIQMIGTSEIKISCIVAQADAELALKQIHQAYGLDHLAPIVEE